MASTDYKIVLAAAQDPRVAPLREAALTAGKAIIALLGTGVLTEAQEDEALEALAGLHRAAKLARLVVEAEIVAAASR